MKKSNKQPSYFVENDQITFSERMPTGVRIPDLDITNRIRFIPFLAPYDLLIRPGWTSFNLMLLFAIIISLGASCGWISFHFQRPFRVKPGIAF